jgi:cell division protein FtsL
MGIVNDNAQASNSSTISPDSKERALVASAAYHYNAFISYSHTADDKLAQALEHGLHRYAKSLFQLRALNIFRDNAKLAANPNLWSSIEEALSQSEYFILLASPEATTSEWVKKEVDTWCRKKPVRNILIVLTEGEIVWNTKFNDFDWDKTTALPEDLHGVFAEEPRWIDLRWARTVEEISLSHAQFRECVADLAAPLHHRPKDELIGDEMRLHRRTRFLIWFAISLLTCLAVAFGITAYLALKQRNLAVAERNRAEAQTKIAQDQRNLAQEQKRLADEARILSEHRQVRAIRALIRTGAFLASKIDYDNQRLNNAKKKIELQSKWFKESLVKFENMRTMVDKEVNTAKRAELLPSLTKSEQSIAKAREILEQAAAGLSWVRSQFEISVNYYRDLVIEVGENYSETTLEPQLEEVKVELEQKQSRYLVVYANLFVKHVGNYHKAQGSADHAQWIDDILYAQGRLKR